LMDRKEYDVTILSRDTIVTYPRMDVKKEVVHITYVASGLPPYTIRIPKDEWNLPREREQIRASIESRLKKKTERYKV